MRYLIAVGLFVVSLNAHSQDEGANVLFLGNSYIFTNDLPGVLDQLANNLGQPFTYEQNTLPGYTLEQHTEDNDSQALLAEGNWDYVILQEQSQMPAFPIDQVTNDVFPYAEALVNAARDGEKCCMPIFMMTWGRENGDAANCDSWPPVCTYEGMQDLLTERYITMATNNECWTAPIGEAWRFVREDSNDAVDLYAADGSHPSLEGTYLAACVLYALIYQESPVGSTYYAGVSESDAQYLQAVTALTVFEEADMWNYHPLVSADMIFSGTPPSITATLDLSAACDSALVTSETGTSIWEDGDMNGYFYSEGIHYWSMELYSTCGNGYAIDSLVLVPDDLQEISAQKWKLYPNPTADYFEISGLEPGLQISVIDAGGRLILQQRSSGQNHRIDCSGWKSGVYSVLVGDDRKMQTLVVD